MTGRSPCTPTRPPKRTAEVGRRPYIFARTDPEGLLGSRPPPDVPQDWTALSVDGSHIDVDRHLPLGGHLINLGGCAITYGAGLRLTAVQRAHPGRGGRDLYLRSADGARGETLIACLPAGYVHRQASGGRGRLHLTAPHHHPAFLPLR